jgi:P27 family predicted phage terminase small subunit
LKGGGAKMAFKTNDIRKELMGRINADSPFEVEKVDRYCNFVDILRELQKGIEEEGVLVTTVNATQEFIKANPALGEMQKINAQLLNIEKSFGFDDESSITESVSLV